MSCVSLQRKLPKFQETGLDLEVQLFELGFLCENVADPDALLESETFTTTTDYDAKGQRERIQYGNGSTTGYTYDEKTFRLKRLLTTRNSGADFLVHFTRG